MTIVCVACTMFTTILAAFAFSRLKFPGRDLLFSLLLAALLRKDAPCAPILALIRRTIY